MTKITAADVNKLRQLTGVGMMDCKKALVESEGDMDKAMDLLRQKGQKLAGKRADRDANEGVVLAKTSDDKKYGAVIMINCETDFVGKNEDFIAFAQNVLDHGVAAKAKTKEEVLDLTIDGSKVSELITDQVGKIGEKIELSHYEIVEAESVCSYIHQGNRLASVVGLNKAGFEHEGHEVAMQVAAMAPISVDKDAVPADVIEREMEVYRAQVREEGKPENMVEKIAQGKLNKFFKESTLLSQVSVRDGKKTVEECLKDADKDLTVTAFQRLMLGA